MELTVYSRSNNHDLWLKMRSLIPKHINCIEVTGFDHWTDASKYLYHIIDNAKTRWIVNIDIDAFVIDWEGVVCLAEHMLIEGFTHSGMSDGNACPHREGPDSAMNPFFNIFDTEKIKPIKHNEGKWLEWVQPQSVNRSFVKGIGARYNSEPFHGLFNILHKNGNPLYLPITMHYDGIANTIDWNHKSILVHAWYSRDYGINEEQTERIDRFYEFAKGLNSLTK